MSGAANPGREFLSALPAAVRDALVASGFARRYNRGDFLFREGEPPGSVILVREGVIKIQRQLADGRELLLGVRGPGAVLGELAALDGSPRSASAIAMATTVVDVLPPAAFRRLVTDGGDGAVAVVKLLVARLREADQRRVERNELDIAGRVVRRLLDLADGQPGRAEARAGAITVRVTQDELAALAGASREGVSRVLGELRDAGLVGTGRGSLTIPERGRLAELVD